MPSEIKTILGVNVVVHRTAAVPHLSSRWRRFNKNIVDLHYLIKPSAVVFARNVTFTGEKMLMVIIEVVQRETCV